MLRDITLLMLCIIGFGQSLIGQEYRSFDGTGNNIENPLLGAAHTGLVQRVSNGFEDGYAAPAGSLRPNPRLLSNRIFGQNSAMSDPLQLSDFCWVWGQFLDHDISLVPDSREPAMIPVPPGDPQFDPQSTGQRIIPMARSLVVEGTGTGEGNPRRFLNEITAFIDASNVYGSDQTRADYLRSFEGGKMRVSSGNLLPYNTIDGAFDSPIDTLAPHMDDAVGFAPRLFVAGDVRANENPLLLSFHILFVREHNRLCDEIATAHPDWDDEQIYQHARKIVGGQMQAIVYEQYLPAMGVDLGDYRGYQPDVDPTVFNVFSAAAFRLGHTLLNGNLRMLEADGNETTDGDMSLRNAFFNPMAIVERGGISPFFKGMGAQVQQRMDAKIINDVRNFLFGPPGSGGLDLAAININRGRERGLPDFNTVRADFGLEPYQFFIQINEDPGVHIDLQYTYFDIEQIDPWVGMLAEKPVPGALFGETLLTIMREQFNHLRDGDRFYYENDPDLSLLEKQRIRMTRLVDIIRRNTEIDIMQEDVFRAMSHEEICAPTTISGLIRNTAGEYVEGVEVVVKNETEIARSVTTDVQGAFVFEQIAKCDGQWIQPIRNDNPANGVTTFDIILVLKDILGTQKLADPYKIIAADVNQSGSVTTSDLIGLRRLILGQQEQFANAPSWRFVDADYVFPDPANPFLESFPEQVKIEKMYDHNKQSFVAVKLGDVNDSAIPSETLADMDVRNRATWQLWADDRQLEAGSVYDITLQPTTSASLVGYQFTLDYDPAVVQIDELSAAEGFEEQHYHIMSDAINVSWNGDIQLAHPITIRLTALTDGKRLSEVLQMSDRYVTAEVYTENKNTKAIQLNYHPPSEITASLYQNTPNPFTSNTIIPFQLNTPRHVELVISDLTGNKILEKQGDFGAGVHQFECNRTELGVAQGIFYYQLIVGEQVWTRPMILID